METVSRDKARQVTEEISAAIAEILERHGMQQRKTSTKYGPSYKISLEAEVVQMEGGVNVASQEAQDFVEYARMGLIGLPEEALGRTFVSQGIEYRLTGYMPQNPKYCFSVERTDDGKRFKFGSTLEQLIKAQL